MIEHTGCRIVRTGSSYHGKQGHTFATGVSAETAGSHGLCLHVANMPPGCRGPAHRHDHHESAIYIVSGEGAVLSGDELRERAEVGPGDFIYVPAGVPHVPVNTSDTTVLTFVVARTDPNEQESIVLLPELDALADR